MFIKCKNFSKILESKLQLAIRRSSLKKLWKNITILVQNLVSKLKYYWLNNNVIYVALWYCVLERVFSFLSQDEVEKMKQEEGINYVKDTILTY